MQHLNSKNQEDDNYNDDNDDHDHDDHYDKEEEEDIFAKEAVTSWLTNITFLNFLARLRDIVGTLMQSTFTDYTQYM